MIPLITVEGPTASGKTAFAIALAQTLDTQIISADSRQVYKHLDLGTAKPSLAERNLVKHHLIDIIDPVETYNAGRFCADAESVIARLQAEGRVPLVCGGTGLYVLSLLNGLFQLPEISSGIRHSLAQELEQKGLSALYERLKACDPLFAARISANDRQRVLRGLEVYQATGKTLSWHWERQQREKRFHAFRILLDPPRELLYQRINRRMKQMVSTGLVEEIQSLLKEGYKSSAPGLNSLGYKEFVPHLENSVPLTECLNLAAQHTRNYAKRQCTWYRKHKFDLTLRSSEFIISTVIQQFHDTLKID